jgi:hypothetical protein
MSQLQGNQSNYNQINLIIIIILGDENNFDFDNIVEIEDDIGELEDEYAEVEYEASSSTPKRKCQRQEYYQIGILQTEEEWTQWLANEDLWTRFVTLYCFTLINILDDLRSQMLRPIPSARFIVANILAEQAMLVLLC